MPSIKDLWPDRWLKPHHLQGRRARVAIESVQVEELYNPRAREHQTRLIVGFHKKQLRLVLNKTQAFALADATGTEDYTRWIGAEVVLSEATAPNGQPTIQISPVPDHEVGAERHPTPDTPTASSHEPEAAATVEDVESDEEHLKAKLEVEAAQHQDARERLKVELEAEIVQAGPDANPFDDAAPDGT